MKRPGAVPAAAYFCRGMQRITDIRRQKRDRERVAVFLDGEFWTGMSENLLAALGLARGDVISPERKRRIEREVVEDKALGWALKRLSERAISEARLREKLAERGYGEEVIGLVVERCRECGALDDRALAEAVISARRQAGQGRRRVARYLSEIGIPRRLAEELLDEAFDPRSEADEAEAALEARYGERRLDPREAERATQFLVRRGFSAGAAREAVSRRRMSPEEAERRWGPEQALEELRRRWRGQPLDRRKASAHLARRQFSSEAIQRAIAAYEGEMEISSSSSRR